MRVLSLFAGIGGIDLGLERAGMTTVAQCEIDPFCNAVLAKHWPNVPRYTDVRLLDGNEWRGRVDLVAGGFPCQDISSAGVGDGIVEGSRSGLWFEMRRIIGGCQPDWAFIENVPRLRTCGADRVLGDMEGLGYSCWPVVVGAKHVGARHSRMRVWIVANHDSARRENTERREGSQTHGLAFAGSHDRQRTRLGRWPHQPNVGRVVHGLSNRLDGRRVSALGNAVVPQIVEAIGRWIMKQNIKTFV